MVVIASPECHRVEGGDTAVAAGQFGGDHAFGQEGQSRAAVADDRGAGDAQPAVLPGQIERKLGALPEPGGGRCHPGVAPHPHPVADLAFGVGEQLVEAVEIRPPGQRQVVTVREVLT